MYAMCCTLCGCTHHGNACLAVWTSVLPQGQMGGKQKRLMNAITLQKVLYHVILKGCSPYQNIRQVGFHQIFLNIQTVIGIMNR